MDDLTHNSEIGKANSGKFLVSPVFFGFPGFAKEFIEYYFWMKFWINQSNEMNLIGMVGHDLTHYLKNREGNLKKGMCNRKYEER